MLVLAGGGAEFERPPPFGAFVDALDDYAGGFDPRRLEDLSAPTLARLASVFPSLAGWAGRSPSYSGHERHGTLEAIRTLVEILAAKRPLVLVVDDLHWAEEASLELVSHLTRRPPRARLLLALGYRPRPLIELAGAAQVAFIEGAADELIEPPVLSRAQAAELVGFRVESGRLDALMAESGGNPFYLEQLVRPRKGDVVHSDLELSGVPPAVAGSIAGELDGLSEQERALGQAAAVVGDSFEPHLAAMAAGVSEDDALVAIDGLVRAGTVRETGAPRRFRFRHPIVRRAAYQATPPGARIIAHRRVAALLAEHGAPPLEQAHHVEAAASPGDADAAALLADAGRAADGRAPAIAARWYAAALRLLPSGDPAERIGLLVALARAQGVAGQLEESRRTLNEILDGLGPDGEALRLKILPFLALVGHMLGRHGEATNLLRREVAELPDPHAPEAAELGIETALDCLYEPDYEAMLRYAGDADRAARASNDPALEAAGAGVSALARYSVGDVFGAITECDRAVGLLAPLTDGDLAGRLEGMLSVAWTAMGLERYADCVAVAHRALVVSRSTGQSQLLVPLTIAPTVARAWQGELDGAATDADELVDVSRLSGVGQSIAWALTLRGWIATLAGDLELASDCGEQAYEIARAQDRVTYFVAHSILHLAETRLEQGRAEECLDEIVAAAGGEGLPICERPVRPRWYEILTRASLELGRLEEAAAWAARAREIAADCPLGGRRCEAALAEGAVQLASGSVEAAERCALDAVRAADDAGDRLLAARARVLAARACATRDRRAAIDLLEEARATFECCGAALARAGTVRELRRLGRRVPAGGKRGRGDRGASALSGREREVAELVSDGLTNREIAARLFLSDRTVETHLAAVLNKLDIRGRAGVASALRGDNGERGL